MTQVAKDAGLSRESLYKALSGDRSPDFDTILRVVSALGLKLHAVRGPPLTVGVSTYDDLVHGVNQHPPIFQAKTRKRHDSREITFRENMVIVIQPNLMTYDEKMGLQFGEDAGGEEKGCETFECVPRQWVTCKWLTSQHFSTPSHSPHDALQ